MVLPRFVLGRRSEVGKVWHLAGGVYFTPPFPTADGSNAWLVGGDGSAAFAAGPIRVGAEANFGYSAARAPVVSSDWNEATIASFEKSAYLDIPPSGCADEGCVDDFVTVTGGAKLGASAAIGLGLAPYVKVGYTWVDYTFDVAHDNTRWKMIGGQASFHGGLNWQFLKKLHITLGASMAYRPEPVSINGEDGLFFTLAGAAGVVL